MDSTRRQPVPYQPPRGVAEFVGRVDELARLNSLLVPGQRVGITGLVGMGGLGKTELAKRAADRAAERFRDGVLWADCKVQTPTTIADTWAGAYGVRLAGDDEVSKAARWRSLACHKEALLIFDDVQAGQDIEGLIPPRGRCAVLLTTRYGVHPALLGATRLDLETFTPAEAAALVDEVLGTGTAADQGAETARLFALTGFLPLALDVALHLSRRCGWGLAELNGRLEAKGALWVLGDEKRLSRSLWATFETAWGSLPAAMAEVFAALPVLKAGASLSTAAMAAVLNRDELLVGAWLHELAGCSLVRSLGPGRWEVHPLVGEFAATRAGVSEGEWRRMAEHYRAVLGQVGALYKQGDDDLFKALTLFDLERGHIEAGQAWAATIADSDDQAARLCSTYPRAAGYVLMLRLQPRERITWLQAGIRAARRLGDQETEGRNLSYLGVAHRQIGDTRRAIEYYEQALRISREIGDRNGEGAALGNLGIAYQQLGEARRAIEYTEQAMAIRLATGDERGVGVDLATLGSAHLQLSNIQQAIEYYERALEIARAFGDRWNESIRLSCLGSAFVHLGDTRRAIEYHEEALAISRKVGDRRGEGITLGYVGLAYADLGNVQRAVGCYEQALQIRREIGHRRGEGADLGHLGLAYAAMGDPQRALEYHEQALAISRDIGDRRTEATHLANMGRAYYDLGDVVRARELWQSALVIYEAIESPHAEEVRASLARTACPLAG